MWVMQSRAGAWLVVALLLMLYGCATAPQQMDSRPIGVKAAGVARNYIGVPYVYGGSSPRGFDCSGLIHYSYRQVGIGVPRTVEQQLNQSQRVVRSAVQPGDLLFFRIEGKPSHVGIYAGNDVFIHAPSGGKTVTEGRLTSPYWASRLVRVGRFGE